MMQQNARQFNSNIRISLAKPWQIGEIVALQRAAIAALPDAPYDARQLSAWMAKPAGGMEEIIAAGRYYVAHSGWRLLAAAGWEPAADGKTASLRAVFVAPEARGTGLGRRITAVAEDAAITAGHGRILVPAALNAVGFYQRLGFERGEQGLCFVQDDGTELPYELMSKCLA
jgi:GNAT superfamily N-acetyltransferase